MLTEELFVDVLVMHKQGRSIRSIAKELKISRYSVRNYLRNREVPAYTQRAARGSKLAPYKPYLLERIKAAHPRWIPATVLLQEIKDQGYAGGITLVRDFVAAQKPKVKDEPVVRFETDPGKQMQIDFTSIRRGKKTLKAFVATLGYSRASFVKFYDNERQESWIDGIIDSFHFFGGVPQEVLCDNAARIPIEGKFGQGKRRFGMSRIMAKLAETSETVIGIIFMVMNLEKWLKSLACLLFSFVILLFEIILVLEKVVLVPLGRLKMQKNKKAVVCQW